MLHIYRKITRLPRAPQTARAGAMGMSCRFTLIELLVVISVVALLMALLLPNLQKMRENGKTLGCLNNERQIGIACNSYAEDNYDRLPNKGAFGNGVKNGSKNEWSYGTNFWPVHVVRYADKPDAKSCDDLKGTVFWCPNHDKTCTLSEPGIPKTYNGSSLNTYGINARINGKQLKFQVAWNPDGFSATPTSGDRYWQFALRKKVVNAGRTVLAADGGTSGANFDIADTYYKEKQSNYSIRHDNFNRICVLFCDGAAKPLNILQYCYGKGTDRIFTSYNAVDESFN